MKILPKDLNQAKEDLLFSVNNALDNLEGNRFTVFLKFEGLRLGKIAFFLNENLGKSYKNIYLTWADAGSVALAKRDYPSQSAYIKSFSEFSKIETISPVDSLLISVCPQPYDFDDFSAMCEKYKGIHISINPKFEDANIGIGQVIRDRRKNFNVSWKNIYSLEPLSKGALMHKYPDKWELYTQENNLYKFKKDFDSKPDNETIYVYL